jgi:hypothetical protein
MPTPAVYISYARGDDTPEGKEREAIVDDLCRNFANARIVIGRDKNEVKLGDSIERLARRIASAPLILAVISHRSLRSHWCMIYELHEAYLRCGSDVDEFAERVAALVLEDAEPDLDIQKTELLQDYWRNWKQNVEKASSRRSHELAKVLKKCEDMIENLPEMFMAIRKIAMPRGSAAIRRDDFSAIIAYVQGKLGGAAQDIPEPPELDLAAMQTTLQKLAHQHAGLSSPQLHACWHAAIQATWPRRTAISLFPKLASTAPLQWTDLQNSLADPGQWRHLQTEKIELLFERFAAMLEAPPPVALAETPSPMPPSLAVLIKPTADKTSAGQAAYRCSAVLCIPLAEGVWHYEQVDATADHVFCFNPPAHRPDWQQPGAVLGRLWMAAKARLTDQGRIDREPLLDLFLPRALFDEDWSSLELEDDCGDLGVMATIFYRLRSIDRWTRPELVLYKEHFERKYTVLTGGAGHWKLLAEDHPSVDLHIPSVELHKQLSLSRTSSPGQPETVAIMHLGSLGVDLRAREKFYRSALESAAPVVLWLHPSLEGQPATERNQHVTQLFKSLNLRKPTKTKNHNQEVRRNPFELPTQKQDLPSGLVVLIEDCLEMDRDRPATPRLITVAEQAPSLGYGTS